MRVAKLAFNVCRRIPRSENRTNSFARLQQSSIHLSDSVLLMKSGTTYTCTVSGRPALLRGSVGCHLGVRDQTTVSPQITNWWLRQDLIREHLFRCHLIPQLCFHQSKCDECSGGRRARFPETVTSPTVLGLRQRRCCQHEHVRGSPHESAALQCLLVIHTTFRSTADS